MYGRGNYAPQFRHGPPRPPLPFQQGPPAPLPPVMQQGSLAASNHVVQPGPNPPVYHHGPPPPPPVQQGQPILVPNPGAVNVGPSFVHPPTSVHGISQVTPQYSNVQQTSQYPSTVTTQNIHYISPPVHPPATPLAGPSHPEMIRPPVPPRVLPPPPSQGLYRTPLRPPLPGGSQGHHHVGPLPSPPPPSFVPVTPALFSSSVHAPPDDAYPPSMPPPPPPPPPPPSSPPPIPSSPPPPPPKPSESSSTSAFDDASPASRHSESSLVCDKPTTSAERLIDDVDRVAVPTQSMEDVSVHDGSQNNKGRSCGQMKSLADDGFSSNGEATMDLPPPLPKAPAEEVVRKIEVLCQFIAKNGPDFEDMARKRESGNPEFAFLFGGEPGSGAAIAHDYFQWMKRKCLLEYKQCNVPGQNNLLPRTWEIKSSPQRCISTDEGASGSRANSDMDMEGDANQSDKDREVSQSVECTSREPVSLCNELPVVNEKLHVEKSLTGHTTDTLPRTIYSSGVAKQEEEHDDSSFGMSSTKGRCAGLNSDGAVECTLDLSIRKVISPVLDDLSPSEASPDAGGISCKEVSGQLSQGGSPFRLIQGYASDDSAEDNYDGPFLENVSPVKVLPHTADGATGLFKDTGTGLDVNVDSRMTEKGVRLFNESIGIDPISIQDIRPESHKVGEATVIPSDALVSSSKAGELGTINDGNQTTNDPAASLDASEQNGSLHSDLVSIDHQDGKLQNEYRKQERTPLKVDEFGRLVREGASDSDSDGQRYSMRRGKRGRSRSRSRSPQDFRRRRRSRSPWRRKERRSRSRSMSPKKRRSRSRSPHAFRRMGEFGFEKIKRGRGQIPDCKNFFRGRCTRGASCRFLHRDSSLHDGSRGYRTKQSQHPEVPHDSGKPFIHGESKNVTPEVSGFEEAKSQDMPLHITDAQKEEALDGKREPVSPRADVEPIDSNEAGQSTITLSGEVGQHERVQETISQVFEKAKPIVQLLDLENLQRPAETLPGLPLDRFLKQSPTNVEKQNFPGESSHGQPPSEEYSVAQLPMDNASALPVLENAGHHPQQIDSPNVSCSLPAQISTTVLGQPPVSEPYPATSSMSQPSSQSPPPQSLASKEFHPPSYPAVGNHFQPSHLPLPHDINTPHVSQPPKDFNLPFAGANFVSQSAPLERFPPTQAPLQDQHSHFLGPQKPSWTSFQASPSYGSHPLQLPQNTMHSRNNFPHAMMRPYQFEERAHSQAEFHPRSFPPMEEPHRPPLQLTDFSLKPLPVDKMQEHHLGGPSFIREEHFTNSVLPEHKLFHPAPQQDYLHPRPHLRDEQHFPLPVRDDVQNFEAPPNQRFTSQFQLQGFTTSSSIFPDNVHSHTVPFPRESPVKQVQPFSKENFGAISRQLPYGLQPSGSDGFSSHFGAPVKADSSRYSSSLLENKQALLSSVGGSKISSTTHYNPFASTFEQPLGGPKSSSSVFRHEIDTNYSSQFESSFSLSHVPADGQGVVGLGLRQTSSPPDSGRPGVQILPRPGDSLLVAHPREAPAENFPGAKSQYARESLVGNQYDPLFDSIEPSPNTLRKFVHHVQEQDLNSYVSRPVAALVASDKDVVSRLTRSHGPLDIEENNKQKQVAAAVTMSPENDEFGETAEVDAVENESSQTGDGKNWSPGSQNVAAGDVEIDQVRSPGKRKKTKDSRSTKLFKSAIADFVKEVLKPSWRQGNMSKEAFKTIVKKTVDKVSGAMKNHHMPKSQAKINQYVESSQLKLTKLVMGYVDKYVKL